MGGSKGNKTQPSSISVMDRIASLPVEKQADCHTLVAMMTRATGMAPVLWGASLIGFGEVQYRYPSGHSGNIFLVGFSPRKSAISLYLTCDLREMADQLARLGKHACGKGCLYVKKLADVDLSVLGEMIGQAVARKGS